MKRFTKILPSLFCGNITLSGKKIASTTELTAKIAEQTAEIAELNALLDSEARKRAEEAEEIIDDDFKTIKTLNRNGETLFYTFKEDGDRYLVMFSQIVNKDATIKSCALTIRKLGREASRTYAGRLEFDFVYPNTFRETNGQKNDGGTDGASKADGQAVSKPPRRFMNEIKITDVKVDPIYRNRGFGTLLLMLLMGYAKDTYVGLIWGELSPFDEKDPDNEARRNHLYKKLGFKQIERTVRLHLTSDALPGDIRDMLIHGTYAQWLNFAESHVKGGRRYRGRNVGTPNSHQQGQNDCPND